MVQKTLRILRTGLYWGLPPAVLILILIRIDIGRLAEVAGQADLALILLGTAFIVPKMVAGALRWHVLAHAYECIRLPVRATIAEYWTSVTLGVFVPGSLGSDAYRVAIGGLQTGGYLRGALVIGIEKVAALFSAALLIATTYPFLRFATPHDSLKVALDAAYIVIGTSFAIPLVAAIAGKSTWISRLVDSFLRMVATLANRVMERVRRGSARDRAADRHIRRNLLAAIRLRLLLPTLSFSLAIPVIGAIQAQIFLQAIGHDLPFLANLIISPLILLVIALPISFGGLGVREGAAILFYGMFGVPAEAALLVSFCGLVSVMVSHMIGVFLYLSRGRSRLRVRMEPK